MSHQVDAGVVLNGVVLPGTEWILRDSRAWFPPDLADAPPRRHWPVTQMVAHWTGGRCRVGPDAARGVVDAMKARLRDDGTLMSVSCHFVISWDGLVFQVCDLARMTIHAGRVLNRDGIGTEMCWPGYESQAIRLAQGGGSTPRTVAGRRISIQTPAETMIASMVRLAETLASLPASTRIAIPRIVPKDTARLKPGAAALFKGVCEHLHSPGSEKEDCAGVVCDALVERVGWKRAA